MFESTKTALPRGRTLAGRDRPSSTCPRSTASWAPRCSPPPRTAAPEGSRSRCFGLGCFWGAEEIFWQTPGVCSTAVGYAGRHTANPTYEEVCSGQTGHTEAVRVVFDPTVVSFADL